MPTQWSYMFLAMSLAQEAGEYPYTVTKCIAPKVMQNIYEDHANWCGNQKSIILVDSTYNVGKNFNNKEKQIGKIKAKTWQPNQLFMYFFIKISYEIKLKKEKEAFYLEKHSLHFYINQVKLNPDKLKTVFPFHNLGSRTHALKPLSRRLNHKHKDKKMNNLPLQPKCHVFHHHWSSVVMHSTRFMT